MGVAGAGQGVPGEVLLVGEGAPELTGLLEGDPAVNLRCGAGIARDDLPAADEAITALAGDSIADTPCLRRITNLHARLDEQFLRRKSKRVFHPLGKRAHFRMVGGDDSPRRPWRLNTAITQ
jgi:hypothetical protein